MRGRDQFSGVVPGVPAPSKRFAEIVRHAAGTNPVPAVRLLVIPSARRSRRRSRCSSMSGKLLCMRRGMRRVGAGDGLSTLRGRAAFHTKNRGAEYARAARPLSRRSPAEALFSERRDAPGGSWPTPTGTASPNGCPCRTKSLMRDGRHARRSGSAVARARSSPSAMLYSWRCRLVAVVPDQHRWRPGALRSAWRYDRAPRARSRRACESYPKNTGSTESAVPVTEPPDVVPPVPPVPGVP